MTVVKTLFALSGNVCAFFDEERQAACEEALTDPGWSSVKAQICHIRGRLPESARYDPAMTDNERNDYDNLLLLCPNHHTRVDDLEPDSFPPAVLEAMKLRAAERSEQPGTWATETDLARYAEMMLRQSAHRETSESTTEPWHVDIAVNWHEEGGSTPYKLRWDPDGDGFRQVDSDNDALQGVRGTLFLKDLPTNKIRVRHDPGDSLRFALEPPLGWIAAMLRHPGGDQKPTDQSKPTQGGYFEFTLAGIGAASSR